MTDISECAVDRIESKCFLMIWRRLAEVLAVWITMCTETLAIKYPWSREHVKGPFVEPFVNIKKRLCRWFRVDCIRRTEIRNEPSHDRAGCVLRLLEGIRTAKIKVDNVCSCERKNPGVAVRGWWECYMGKWVIDMLLLSIEGEI